MKYPVAMLVSMMLAVPAAGAAQTNSPSSPQTPGAQQPRSSPAPKSQPQEPERTAGARPSTSAAFLMKAGQDDRGEMEIAGLAQQKSKDDRVKAFADQLMKDHQQADSELQTLAKTKNVTLSTDLPSEAVAAKARLSKLEGAAFDRAFVDQMVKDHTQAVKQFEQATKSADAEVKAFADKTLPTLRDHLQRAEDLKRTIGASGK